MTVYSEWHKSSYSSGAENCLGHRSATEGDGTTFDQVQDTKNPNGPHLSFHRAQWTAFLDNVTPVRKWPKR